MRRYMLFVDLPCACLLCALSNNVMTYREIKALFNGNSYVSSRVVSRLAASRLIKRTGKTSKLSDDDIISLVKGYTSKAQNVHIPPALSEQKKIKVENAKQIDYLVQESIDAAIVRTLKGNRRMNYQIFETLVIEKLHDYFICTGDQIRRRLPQLSRFASLVTEDGVEFIEYVEGQEDD